MSESDAKTRGPGQKKQGRIAIVPGKFAMPWETPSPWPVCIATCAGPAMINERRGQRLSILSTTAYRRSRDARRTSGGMTGMFYVFISGPDEGTDRYHVLFSFATSSDPEKLHTGTRRGKSGV